MSDLADARVAWMRRKGVVQAQWHVDGVLTMCVLGPEPFDGPVPDVAPTNQEPDDEAILFMSS